MKPLYFHAVAGNPKIAPPLMRQAESTLRPFNRFLAQAIRTAKKRQVRYQLPWGKVNDPQRVQLTAMDQRAVVPRRPSAWRIADWPPDIQPDLAQPVMVVSRGLMIGVVDYSRDAGGLRLSLDGELLDDDRVFWCDRPCLITRESAPPAPAAVEAGNGTSLRLLRAPQLEEDGWLLLVADWNGQGALVVDGEVVTPRVLPDQEGLRRLRDGAGRLFELRGGVLKVEELPADGPLTGDNGVRFEWRAARADRGGGMWVQLLPPESEDNEDFLDPRAAFCEGDVREVWTQARHSKAGTRKVKRVDSERYQLLLDDWPPPDTSLFLPVDTRNLQLQQRALRQLTDEPLPHHQGLLRLCEDPARVRWPLVRDAWPQQWTALTDLTRSGTDEQRAFVAKALGSPDIAMLEGPPGSGKTTAICELIQQLAADGKRVLLCASTHVAIDNVLERLIESDVSIYPVRIGRAERVDEKVQATQIDRRVADLVQAWQGVPHLRALGAGELEAMAVRTVVSAANLTCGTTMGIVSHPLFTDGDQDARPWERRITAMPHWDVLIVDEASKTLIQEFLVPALMAKRWVIVGDVQQLPPFADRADIVANLRSLADERGREVFPADHQRACLILSRLAGRALRRAGPRWLIVEPPGVLDRLGEELLRNQEPSLSIARVVARTGSRRGGFHEISAEQIRAGDPAALALLAYDWILVADDLLPAVADHLPADLLHHCDLTRGEHGIPESHALLFRHAWWLARAGRLSHGYRERRDEISTFGQAERYEQSWLAGHDLAAEIAWRLTRVHELKHSRDQRERERLIRSLADLQPGAVDISEPIAEIRDIGLPSILEVLQEGIGAGQTSRPSALTEGMPGRQPTAFRARFGSLSYQHRMHADISAFPRELIYEGRSLLDANTIAARDLSIDWTFGSFPARRVWTHVNGRDQQGVNAEEIRVMEAIIGQFLSWAQHAGLPQRSSRPLWEVACLCFYVKQERAMSGMLRRVTGDDRQNRFTAGNVELVCGTVDRFQGREADLVLLSMRNTRRVGFLDSRNRLNVAITRARQQLVVLGNAPYFADCRITELEELVKRSPREDGQRWLRGMR